MTPPIVCLVSKNRPHKYITPVAAKSAAKMSAQLRYERAAETDLAMSVDLRAAMTRELGARDPDAAGTAWRGRFVDFFASRMRAGTAAVLMAKDRSVVAGMAGVYVLVNHRSEIYGQPAAYITSLYVRPEYRRIGIAAGLARAAVDWAREKGCVVVRLRTSDMGRGIYERLGFKRTSELELELKHEE